MPAMLRRRLIALVAIFSIAFGALWPLVSAAKPRSAEIPSFICTQSGVAQHPAAPGDPRDDFHCPLCIASADGVVPVVPAAGPQPVADSLALDAPSHAVASVRFTSTPPPSRAPPFLP
jgi:hypothetical protein